MAKYIIRKDDMELYMIGVLVFIYGIVIGSFLNVCIYRIPKGESIVYPPSHCGSCNTNLKHKDLIPIISYILLGGKCRYCGQKVSKRYLLVEIFTGILFLLLYFGHGLSFTFIKYCVASAIMIVIGLIDFDTMDVYTSVTKVGIISGIVFLLIEVWKYNGDLVSCIIGVLISAIIFFILVYGVNGMGAGDIEIAVVGSVFLQWKLTVFMILSAFIIGGIIGIALLVTKKAKKEDAIPFGPCLSIAFFITVLVGTYVVNWYQFFL